jgi:hypothetical protein
MKNKEVIDKLQAHFLESEPAVVARCLAAMLVDMHRLLNAEHLMEAEASSLMVRMHLNDSILMDFVEDGTAGLLKYVNLPSEEE